MIKKIYLKLKYIKYLMGLYSIDKKPKIDNPLSTLSVLEIEQTYNELVIDQANYILPFFTEKLKQKKLYRFFKIFEKEEIKQDEIIIILPIKMFPENLDVLYTKGFIPQKIKPIQEIDEEPLPLLNYEYDDKTKHYTYKFQWISSSLKYFSKFSL